MAFDYSDVIYIYTEYRNLDTGRRGFARLELTPPPTCNSVFGEQAPEVIIIKESGQS